MTIRMLFRRLAAACAQNVRPFARRVPIEAIANVTMGRTMTTTARSDGRRSSPCPSAIERQTARPRLAIPTTTPADKDDRDRERDGLLRSGRSSRGRPAVSSVAVVIPRHSRIEMAARDRAEGVSAGDDGQTKRE